MPRTTADLVKGIAEVDDGVVLDPFIASANRLVTKVVAPVNTDADELADVETWLAAHLYHILSPQSNVDQVGSTGGTVRQQYDTKVDLALNVTKYGQQAMVLDTSGALANWNATLTKGGTRKLRVIYLGKSADDMLEYEDGL